MCTLGYLTEEKKIQETNGGVQILSNEKTEKSIEIKHKCYVCFVCFGYRVASHR